MNDSDGYDNSVLIINDDGEMDYSDSEVTIYNDDDHYHSNNNNNIVDEKFIVENLVTCIIDDDYDNKNSVSKVANDKQPTKEAMIPLDDTVENAKVKIIDDNGKDADDDDDSSDDDTNSVNVIINDWRPPEHELDDLLDANDFHDEKEFINLPTQEVNQLVLKNIEKTRSNSPRRYILIYVNGITIPVAVENTKLSAAIQYNIWYPPKCTRTDYKMIAVDSFNKKMMNMYSQFVENTNRKCDDGCRNGEYVGYFAAMYDNAVNGKRNRYRHYYNHRQHYHQQRRQHQYQLQQQQQNYYHHVNYARCRREEDDSTGATTVAARFCRNLVNRKKNLRLVRVKNNNNS
ncbi:uncharacterized protein LOC112602137 isoform X3 [Melanaphis sacchari]|uniref:uncharacterized protein LOC112602137 isoform X3 n=1 Tax=Melanaphis sacchari TaxID=742174 RepID=UPI000DC14796|nr:uncharacterized protein LOC112602137 isoform X3 [Melanaphis sacchari]